jgi:hypothetical protein
MGVLMKHHIPISMLLFVAGFLACQLPFPADFNRIEEKKLRVIGVTYLPSPDVAPGDTVTARAYFAGNKVIKVDNVTLAFNAFGDETGIDFVETPLPLIASQSWLPDSFQYTFVLPDSVIVREFNRYPNLSTSWDSIARLLLQPKDSVISYLSSLSEQDQSTKIDLIKKTFLWSNTLFSAYAENGTSIRVVSSFAVRYHSRFPEYLSVNHNPSLSWMAVYRVPRSNAMGFDPFYTGPDAVVSKQYLYNADHPDSVDTQVVIDTGYSYFLAGDNGIVHKDSNGVIFYDTLWDSEINGNGAPVRESYAYKWFYQNGEMVANHMDSLLVIDDYASGPFAEFKPPINAAMHHFNVWVAVTDRYDGSFWYRPVGMAVKGVSGEFSYTDAYRRQYPNP